MHQVNALGEYNDIGELEPFAVLHLTKVKAALEGGNPQGGGPGAGGDPLAGGGEPDLS